MNTFRIPFFDACNTLHVLQNLTRINTPTHMYVYYMYVCAHTCMYVCDVYTLVLQ